ncbi:DUF6298 domain-containing protein [Mucilaginibacter aquatilis]|uniref:Pectate lyase n=1 Tax=Mucilaginibacter aquatilis TaxID=1517760 RepID=A0A6I4I5F9_9SPHI|nr:DUF6298 domain-containing protein [Mucilaginibacter aquatilis]MVN90067.1 pectate lyase [Mucilaginibacter aquatilis]
MCAPAWAQKANKVKPQPPVAAEKSGKLVYAVDGKGNRIPDYSYAGYKAAEQPIPDAAVKVVVPVKAGDATVRIQAAIDYVAALPANKSGLKGAVLLQKGIYQVNGSLIFKSSGVVLRGSGMGNDGTTLVAAGTDRETFIRVAGKDDRKVIDTVNIADAYVPVNATSFTLAGGKFKAGDHIFIRRPSTKNWIDLLKTDHFGGGITALGWKPGERDVIWDRTVTAASGNKISIDAPLTTALDTAYGGGLVNTYQWAGRINNIGIENLKLQSAYDVQNSKDEAHRWMAITMENVQDAWVRQVAFEHFAGSAVFVLETSSRITVQDCKSTAPVSEIGGQRRYTFYTMGGQTLFQRLYAEHGYHDFAVGYCAPGPNAFVQCQAWQPFGFSGTIDSWSSGVLFDLTNIDGQALSYMNCGQDGQGAGWTTANSMFWNCTAGRVDCYQPPGAQNWAYGTWAQFAGDGHWEESNNSINPRSFYYAQLKERLGREVSKEQSDILPFEGEASSSPTVEVAMALTANSVKPAVTLGDWVNQASQRNPITIIAGGAKTIDQIGFKQPTTPALAAKMAINNGWLVRGNTVLSGSRSDSPWWNGSVDPVYLKKNAKPAVTRWVPGRTGTGLTDDLTDVVNWMQDKHIAGFEQNYALWYERRRDDHERIRRIDGDVWPPFYELPFARSGKETAWDGLSKYDLTTYNKWYWNRLKQFATLADQKGLVLINHTYFQHNIIEAGAHYADFPWRPVNNINNTGFPEPVPYAGDKRVFMAEQFYDETHPVRRKLHQAFIRQNLDAFGDNNGVIQFISAEFTGPLHFAKFWVETIQQWEKEKGKNAVTGISTTKDVQDAILANPALSAGIDVIDIRYWHYQADGKVYAPAGGQNLAPRQQARQFKPKATSFEQVYHAVSEYRQKYPEKAVIYSGDGFDRFGWAAFMAGGSLPNLPAAVDARLLADASAMKILSLNGEPKDQWALGNTAKGFIIYSNVPTVATPAVDANANYEVNWIDTKTGKTISTTKQKGVKLTALQSPASGSVVLWLKRI